MLKKIQNYNMDKLKNIRKISVLIFIGILAGNSLHAQSWLKMLGKAAKPKGVVPHVSAGAKVIRPLPSVPKTPSIPTLEDRVSRAVALSALSSPSYRQLALLMRNTSFAAQLPPMSRSSIPEQARVLRNQYITSLPSMSEPISAERLQEALTILRKDLSLHLVGLKSLAKYKTVEELARELPHNPQIRFALEAVGNVSAIGLYGNSQDNELLFQFYDSLKDTPLEPLALTAAVRACVNVHAGATLDSILALAPNTSTYEQLVAWLQQERIPVRLVPKVGPVQEVNLKPIENPLIHISRLSGLHVDPSGTNSSVYISLRFHPKVQFPAIHQDISSSELFAIDLTQPPFRPVTLGPVYAPNVLKNTAQAGRGIGVAAFADMPSPQNMFPLSEKGVYEPAIPTEKEMPRVNLITKQYPSGLQDEERLIRDWLEYYTGGYFHPRDQIEAIRGMSAQKANNIMEYLYYMSMEEAERVILNPLREHGRLPDFMYDARLIPGTQRLPAGYYKNKFNDNVKRLIELAEEDGSVFTRNVELKDLIASMEDYSFEQGFAFTNNPQMATALRRHWKVIVDEVQKRGVHANRHLMNAMWRKPILLEDGQTVSLRLYFSQTSRSAFFEGGRMPEFYLNSPKWVSWENERRNLAAQEYMRQTAPVPAKQSWWEKLQDMFVLGNRSNYLTLEQFGQIMTSQYKQTYGAAWRDVQTLDLLADPTDGPSSCTVRINNFDKPGGVCQASFSDGGYMGKLPAGYDGTSTMSRFTPVEFKNVPVVGFDFATLTPRVMTLNSVPYLKDLKTPNINKLRASIMVRDGLDVTRDLLSVQQADEALFKIPHLKATIYPHSRLKAYEGTVPPFMNGGGLAGYLALFTPDFYPLKKVLRLRFVEGHWRWVPEYFVRKEVPALAGLVHRDYLTFTYMLFGRSTPDSMKDAISPGTK